MKHCLEPLIAIIPFYLLIVCPSCTKEDRPIPFSIESSPVQTIIQSNDREWQISYTQIYPFTIFDTAWSDGSNYLFVCDYNTSIEKVDLHAGQKLCRYSFDSLNISFEDTCILTMHDSVIVFRNYSSLIAVDLNCQEIARFVFDTLNMGGIVLGDYESYRWEYHPQDDFFEISIYARLLQGFPLDTIPLILKKH